MGVTGVAGLGDGPWTFISAAAGGSASDGAPPATVVVRVDEANQVGEARRAAVAMAARLEFAESDLGRVALAATEAATNLARHATGGVLLVQPAPVACRPAAERLARHGIEIVAVDRGPGIRDLARASMDGFSTGGTAGQGLGAMRRVADQFDLFSLPARWPDPFTAPHLIGGPGVARTRDATPRSVSPSESGVGTIMLVRLWAGVARGVDRALPVAEAMRVGGVSVPLAGESECGDAWAACTTSGGNRVLVADGLGHGYAAAEAAQLAVRLFRADIARAATTGAVTPLTDLLEQLHTGLRATRGAAVAIAEVHGAEGTDPAHVRFVGVGNVAASVTTTDGEIRSLVSHNGTVGHQLRKLQEFRVPWPAGAVLVLHTDGIRTQWRLNTTPGLAQRDPTVIAASLWRDHARGRDDATVVVLRETAGDTGEPQLPAS